MLTKSFIYGLPGSGKTLSILEALDAFEGSKIIIDFDNCCRFKAYKRDYVVPVEEYKHGVHHSITVVDTLASLYKGVEKKYCAQKQIKTLEEIPYGKAVKEVSTMVVDFLNSINCDHLILVGHAKIEIEEIDVSRQKIRQIIGQKSLTDEILCNFDAIGYFSNKNIYFSKRYGKYNKSRYSEEKNLTFKELFNILIEL